MKKRGYRLSEIRDYEYIKNKNKWTVFQNILKEAPISRAEVSRQTKMSPTTITRIVKDLMEEGYIKESDAADTSKRVGRKAIILDVVEDAAITIGVFVDKHVQRIGIIGLQNKLLAYEKFKLETRYPEAYIEQLCAKIEAMIVASKIERRNINGIGVGIPGIIDAAKGLVNLSATLGWHSVKLAEKIEARLEIKTIIDNELKTRALAEYRFGGLEQSERTAIISFGSGVGSALIVNNEIYRGSSNSAGEIGHTTVDVNGKRCQCGKKGCLQTYIIEEELIKQAREHESVDSLEEIFAYYKQDVVWAKEIIDQAIQYIYVTISNVVCMYNPDTIIVDGLLIKYLRTYNIDITESDNNDYVWEPLKGTFQTTYSSLGNRGVTIGAGLLAQHKFFELE